MENSIKAIYMGVGMLIAILVIGIFVYMFRSAARFGETYEEEQALRQAQAFNAQFEVYVKQTKQTDSETKGYSFISKGNTVADVISCANLVNSINAKNEYDMQNQITMTVETNAGTFYIYPIEEQPNNIFWKDINASNQMSFTKFLNDYNEIRIVDVDSSNYKSKDEIMYKYYFDVLEEGITYSEETGRVTWIDFELTPTKEFYNTTVWSGN